MSVYSDGLNVDVSKVAAGKPTSQSALVAEIDQPSSVDLVVEVDWQLFQTSLESVDDLPKPEPLTSNERDDALRLDWRTEDEKRWFSTFLTSNGLWKKADESDIEFAYRVEQFEASKFHYDIPPNSKDDPFTQWKYAIQSCSGECWKLSDIYTQTLRMNSIPVREVSGNLVDGGHHVRCLAYLDAVGWTPIEVTFAVCKHDTTGTFGTWGGPMLNGNWSIWLDVPTKNGPLRVGTFDKPFWRNKQGRSWQTDKFTFQQISR